MPTDNEAATAASLEAAIELLLALREAGAKVPLDGLLTHWDDDGLNSHTDAEIARYKGEMDERADRFNAPWFDMSADRFPI